MSGTTRAAVLTRYREPVELQEIAIPDPEPGALVVRVLASTVCGTDAHIYEGRMAFAATLPLILGHEIIGEVVESAGRDVDAFGQALAVGDRVAWAYAWCGRCFWCTEAGQPTLCPSARRYGWGPSDRPPYLTGGFAQHAYVLPECGVLAVDPALDPRLAAAATCSLRTVAHGFERLGGLRAGETVVVQGSGPVGLWATAWAVRSGAGRVVVIGAPEPRLALARQWGASETISIEEHSSKDRREQVLALTGGRGADVILECSGAPTAMGEGIELARPGGRMAVIGQSGNDLVPVRASAFVSDQLTVVGVKSGDISHYRRALDFLGVHGASGDFDGLLGSSYGLDGVTEAVESVASQQEMKPVILP